ncbi:hypothetical protein B0T16DRAFT_124521 [Cercophora newfieldiana]|uniref:Uncharacterized protein n=1 Tax=Cercophora newfieldiana TaxID=92897 RepID=A0AA39YAJ8_9PEZI|nr:hypothetical protein B0T16DRAFT_124521 [Cercophora newfieldiana]
MLEAVALLELWSPALDCLTTLGNLISCGPGLGLMACRMTTSTRSMLLAVLAFVRRMASTAACSIKHFWSFGTRVPQGELFDNLASLSAWTTNTHDQFVVCKWAVGRRRTGLNWETGCHYTTKKKLFLFFFFEGESQEGLVAFGSESSYKTWASAYGWEWWISMGCWLTLGKLDDSNIVCSLSDLVVQYAYDV